MSTCLSQYSAEHRGSSPSMDWFRQLLSSVTRPCSGGCLHGSCRAVPAESSRTVVTLNAVQLRLILLGLKCSQQCLHPKHCSVQSLHWFTSSAPNGKCSGVPQGVYSLGRGFLCFGLFQAGVPRVTRSCCGQQQAAECRVVP